MTTLSKETAHEMVRELEALPFMHCKNSASFFGNSISWHPSWHQIFKLIKEVKAEYETLVAMRGAIQQAIVDGKTYTFTDWGGGWEWSVEAVDIDGKTIRLFGDGACIYGGQHDRQVITLD